MAFRYSGVYINIVVFLLLTTSCAHRGWRLSKQMANVDDNLRPKKNYLVRNPSVRGSGRGIASSSAPQRAPTYNPLQDYDVKAVPTSLGVKGKLLSEPR